MIKGISGVTIALHRKICLRPHRTFILIWDVFYRTLDRLTQGQPNSRQVFKLGPS